MGGTISLALVSSAVSTEENSPSAFITEDVDPFYLQPSISKKDYVNKEAVSKAIDFVLRNQRAGENGKYFLTTPGVDDVVPMDNAHAVLALSKVKETSSDAKSAMNWLLGKMTTPEDPDAIQTKEINGKTKKVNYAGSWWDHFDTKEKPKINLTRGRAEEVGISLIALYTIYQEDPSYPQKEINGKKVIDYVKLAGNYLISDSIQKPDGRFNHTPEYNESFAEEMARMIVGLQLSAEMLEKSGDLKTADLFKQKAGKGIKALFENSNVRIGMPYDVFGPSALFKLDGGKNALNELQRTYEQGLVTERGVKNWDWRANRESFFSSERWKLMLQNLTESPAPTFDWMIANLQVGNDLKNLFNVLDFWLKIQRKDGSFPSVTFNGIGLGPGDTYAADRFILFNGVLTEAINRNNIKFPKKNGERGNYFPKQGIIYRDKTYYKKGIIKK